MKCFPYLSEFVAACAMALMLALQGCGGGDGDSRPDLPTTAAQFTERGWERFGSGDFDGALSDFDNALGLDAGHGPAYLGQGWARLSLATSSAEMELATASFDSALAYDQAVPECMSGRAAAYLGVGGNPAYISAISDAALALQLSPYFVFAHRNSFNATDLRLIEAFAFAAQGHFPAALSCADEITVSGIAQGEPATWAVDGKTYSSFEGAVLALLQRLSDEYSG